MSSRRKECAACIRYLLLSRSTSLSRFTNFQTQAWNAAVTANFGDMLPPVALSEFPSCRDAISWSADGELAVAAGDHFLIMVLLP